MLDPLIQTSHHSGTGAGRQEVTVEGPTAVAHTPLGSYAGRVQDGVAAFKGVPYAQPPFGVLRFRAPEPVKPHDGVRPCLEHGPTVPKAPYPAPVDTLLAEPVIPGQDCLNLNVWTPDHAVGSASSSPGLPVLVWIHGGAFAHGSGAVSTYDGTRFARDGVVCVTINYRLGADGFLLLDGVPANRGLLDQVAALEWVRDNIAGFGGDPDRVTVAGESAGAMSISTLLAVPRAAGLFRQAVTQSGAAAHVHSAPIARRVTAGLARLLGVEPTVDAFAGVGLEELIAGQSRFSAALAGDRDPRTWGELAFNSMPFEPTVDGDVLPAPPLELIRGGAGSPVRLLTGTNREEMTFFLASTGLVEVADDGVLAGMAALYGLSAEGVEVYREARPEASPGELVIDLVTDWFFRVPAIRVAEARATNAEPTFVYEFSWRTPQWGGRLGATHAAEVAFVFDNLDDPAGVALIGSSPPQALADEMHRAWVDFVAGGDPGWPAYRGDRTVMAFGAQEGPSRPVLDPRGQTRAVWDGLR